MYVTHFKMTAQPFQERAPIGQILKDDRVQQGLARLNFLKDQGNIALITGATGVGKSILIKLFLNSLNRSLYQTVYIHFTHVKNTSLLKLIASGLGEVPRLSKERVFGQILEKTLNSELTTILLIDEGQLLQSDALTDLRLLVSSALEKPPFKLLLVGQEKLRNQLQRTRHTDLLQRINIRYHLSPLSRSQTIDYIDFQMKSVEASEKIFDPEVKNAIYDYTHGIPRQINNIASTCLLNAAVQNVQRVDEYLFAQAMNEFQLA